MNRSNDSRSSGGFRHEALLYNGRDEFVAQATNFVSAAIRADEAVFVMVDQGKTSDLREAVDAGDDRVEFFDVGVVGRNPARIIPTWRDFVNLHVAGGRPLRGIGESVWSGDGQAQLAECHIHESLVDLAFDDDPPFWMLCLYDIAALQPETLTAARRTHAFVSADGERQPSAHYRRVDSVASANAYPLTAVPDGARRLVVESPVVARRFVEVFAADVGLSARVSSDLILAVSELVSNSVQHGAGVVMLDVWLDDAVVNCEVRDDGRFADPMVGRRRPSVSSEGGRGLWIVNQLCDLVQIRSSEAGSVVRIQIRRS